MANNGILYPCCVCRSIRNTDFVISSNILNGRLSCQGSILGFLVCLSSLWLLFLQQTWTKILFKDFFVRLGGDNYRCSLKSSRWLSHGWNDLSNLAPGIFVLLGCVVSQVCKLVQSWYYSISHLNCRHPFCQIDMSTNRFSSTWYLAIANQWHKK